MSDSTFLATFRSYLMKRTDAPKDFHLHAGLCALSVALGNRVWCDGPSRDVFPNLHCVILAPSGMGKSVPLDMANLILQKAQLGDTVLPSSFSREAILKRLAKQPVGIFILQEFAAFMALLNRDYNHGAMEDLTDVYDGSDIVRELTSETLKVSHPAVTLLGASSPDWFAQAFSAKNLRGGYLARFLFCPSRDATDPIGDPGPRDEGTEAGLAMHLMEIAQLHGKMDMSACHSLISDYATKRRLEARQADPDIAGMRSRAPVMAKKVAMLFHVSREASMTVSLKDMEAAIKFVDHTHDMAERYLMDEVARDRKDSERLRILEIVRGQGGRCEWSYALKRSKQDAVDFKRNADTLCESGQLEVQSAPRGERGKWLALPAARYENSPIHGNSRELVNSRNGYHGELAGILGNPGESEPAF